MAVSVLFRIDGNGHIKVVDGGPAPVPAVVVDADRQLHAAVGGGRAQRRAFIQ